MRLSLSRSECVSKVKKPHRLALDTYQICFAAFTIGYKFQYFQNTVSTWINFFLIKSKFGNFFEQKSNLVSLKSRKKRATEISYLVLPVYWLRFIDNISVESSTDIWPFHLRFSFSVYLNIILLQLSLLIPGTPNSRIS